jgi:hypothetical protein
MYTTILCRYCKKYLVGRGCIHELKYEQTGLCEGFEQKQSKVNTMIVDYDKELDVVYISKKINDRWIQVGFTSDEVDQINNAKGGT